MREGRQAVWQVKNGIARQKKTVIFCMLWSLFGIYKVLADWVKYYEFMCVDVSIADVLIVLQNFRDFGIIILPAVVFMVMRCKLDSLNLQFVIRHTDRPHVLYRQCLESVLYSAGVSAFIVAVEIVFSVVRKMPALNWDSENSIYFHKTHMLVSEHFIFICLAVYLMYFVKCLIIMVLLDVLLWFPKWIFLIWFVIITMAGMDFLSMEGEFNTFFSRFSIQFVLWQDPWEQHIWVLAGLLIALAEYVIGCIMIRKRDIFK